MSNESLILKRQLLKVIKHFKFDELETLVLPLFPEMSWRRIKTQLVKKHQAFSVENAIKEIQIEIEKQGVNENLLKERLSILEVLDISRHHNKKTWHCYELKGPNTQIDFMTKRDIENQIIDHCRTYEIQVEVKTTSLDGITFAAIREKPKNNKIMRFNPFFFALLVGQKNFFSSKKNVATYLTNAVASAMGHSSSKKVKLVGKDLTSLIKFLWQKKQGASDVRKADVIYQEFKPIIRSTGIDFTQTQSRKEYMDQVFGNDPPTLESLALESIGQAWIVEDSPSLNLSNKTFPLAWEFKSQNITTFLQNLAERNVLVTPVPDYLSQWISTGKNHLSLK